MGVLQKLKERVNADPTIRRDLLPDGIEEMPEIQKLISAGLDQNYPEVSLETNVMRHGFAQN